MIENKFFFREIYQLLVFLVNKADLVKLGPDQAQSLAPETNAVHN